MKHASSFVAPVRPRGLVSLISAALATSFCLVPGQGLANGGYGSGIGSGLILGGAGGKNGSLAEATGANGLTDPTSSVGTAGGGGAVDLETGNGAAGGARGIGGTASPTTVYGTAGATGATGLVVSAVTTVYGAVTGGNGGSGQVAVTNVNTTGGGGGGGVGISATADLRVAGSATINGGNGRSQGSAGSGAGGSGIFSRASVNVEAGATISGGNGSGSGSGAGGGAGGIGVLLGPGGGLANAGAIAGGTGGNLLSSLNGGAGDGGAGVWLTSGGTVTNLSGGSIAGGTGGSATFNRTQNGQGGAGVTGTNVTVINAGVISGGLSGALSGAGAPPPVRAAAVEFIGGINSLEIRAGSILNGDAVAFSRADTLRLGGDADAGFDVSAIGGTGQYRGFGLYEKVGASTWTLTGATAEATPWTISAGMLSISDDASLGASQTGLTLNGGTLQTTSAISTSRVITLTGAGGTIETKADLTSGGIISGNGALTKSGPGVLTLQGENTYAGGTRIIAGTVAIDADHNLGAAQSSVVLDGGTLRNTSAVSMNRDIVLGDAGGTLWTDADLSNTGNVRGAGGLTKAGAGTLTLTGSLDYTGATTIAAGTLVTPASGLGTGPVINNGVLVLDQAIDGQLGNAINGTGTLIKQGTGRLNVTGSGNLSGTTFVQAGTLAVNGSLANSSVDVAAGGVLAGNGTVGATTVRGGGSVSPGNSIGTLHVNGDFAQQAGSNYLVELDTTSADLINISGQASLAPGAGLSAARSGSGLYKVGTNYTVLTAAGGVTGTYTLNPSLTPFLGLTDSYDANNVYLRVVQTAEPGDIAETPNQSATAGGSKGTDILDPLLSSPTVDAARNALDQLSGSALASTKGAMIHDSRFTRQLAIDRLRDVLCAAGTDPRAVAERNRQSADCVGSRRAIWAQGYGGWGHSDGNSNASGINRSSAGFVMGVDVPVAQNWRAGALAGYSSSRYTVDNPNARTRSSDYHLGIYGGAQWDKVALRLGSIYTWHDLNSSRTVTVPGLAANLTSDHRAQTAQAFGELAYQLNAGPVALEPFLNLAYVNLHTDGFEESGGLAALRSRASNTETTFSTLGLRASTDLNWEGGSATVRGLVGWRRAYGDLTPTARVSFGGGNPFTVTGVPVGRDAAVIGAAADLHLSSNVTLGLAFDGQFSRGANDQVISGTLRVAF